MLLYRLTGSSVLFIKHVDCLFPKVELLPLDSPLPPTSPFREPLPDHWNTDLDDFQKLLALKCVRADKLTNAMQVYVCDGVLAQRNNHLPQMGAVLHCHHMLTCLHAHMLTCSHTHMRYAHMLTHSHAHIHTLTFTRSRAHNHMFTLTFTRSHAHIHMLTCSHSHTYTDPQTQCTHTYTWTRVHTCTHTHITHMHIHTCTYSHMHAHVNKHTTC